MLLLQILILLAVVEVGHSVHGDRLTSLKKIANKRKNLIRKVKKKVFGIFKRKQIKPKSEIIFNRNMPVKPMRGWVDAENGTLPPRAYIAGVNEEQKFMYVARMVPRLKSNFIIGVFVQGATCARAAENGFSHCYRMYQVLVGKGYIWVKYHKDNLIHPDAIVGDKLMTFYICRRATHQNTYTIGYIDSNIDQTCRYGVRGIQYTADEYELLIDVWV